MSQRAHFWIRIVGLAVIVAAEFGPRLWAGTVGATGATQAPIAAAADAR